MRYVFPVIGVVCGVGLALGLIAAFILSDFSMGDAWDAPAAMEYMDCSEAGICRHFPNRDHELRHGGGGTFHVRSNSLGFRGEEPPPQQRDPRRLVVQMYGDSMVYGTGVGDSDTIAARLREHLGARFPDREVHVQNFGMPMNYLRSQFAIYEAWGRQYDSDIVIFQYRGHIPSPRDINHRVRQIRDSSIAPLLFRFDLGRRLINRYQSLEILQYSDREALKALEPGIELLRVDQRDRGLRIAVFSFGSDFTALDRIFPAGFQVVKIGSGIDGWEAYRASEFIIPGDGHPNPAGTRMFAARIAEALAPIIADAEG